MEKRLKIKKCLVKLFCMLLVVSASVTLTHAQKTQKMVFDTFHGQNPKNATTFQGLLNARSHSEITASQQLITDSLLDGKHALILFSPTKPFGTDEKETIVRYLKKGGSLLLIFDEDRRTNLSEVGINDFLKPFGLEFTGDAPVRHNCGAIAEKSRICKDRRELPYSGGRSIIGGEVVSRVYDEGNYIHCAYKKTGKGKIILMSDGMAGLLMGSKDGVRFSGTNPSDSKYWGKDSEVFMKEILEFLAS